MKKQLGVPQNYETARRWYEKAAANGQTTAMDVLAFLKEGNSFDDLREKVKAAKQE